MAKKEANLLVTFNPSHQESALNEIKEILNEVKEKPEVIEANEGVAELLVKNAKKAVKEVFDNSDKLAGKFINTFHWIPIEKWCKATEESMKTEIKELIKGIKQNDKWKMDLKVRKVKEKPDEVKLIMKLTEVVDRPNVDLKNPEKIIKVEVIGNKAGLSLLNNDELFNAALLNK